MKRYGWCSCWLMAILSAIFSWRLGWRLAFGGAAWRIETASAILLAYDLSSWRTAKRSNMRLASLSCFCSILFFVDVCSMSMLPFWYIPHFDAVFIGSVVFSYHSSTVSFSCSVHCCVFLCSAVSCISVDSWVPYSRRLFCSTLIDTVCSNNFIFLLFRIVINHISLYGIIRLL